MTAPQSTPLPPAPQRGESEDVFVNKSNTWVAAQEVFRQELQEQADFVNNEVVDLDSAVTASAASASAALTSENNASNSESNASTSETNAAASELAASNSASAASASESNAASSESAASSSATTASNAATAAEASETIATTKASEASASATSSANSATLSQDAKTLAQAAGNYAGRWADLTGSVAAGVSVAHNSEYWGSLVSIADITLSEPGVSSDWLSITELSGTAAQRDTGTDFDQVPLNTNIVYPVATVADLRLLEPTVDGQKFKVTSYYAGWGATVIGPIGGDEFVYDASDTTSVDNGGTIIVTAGGKRLVSTDKNNVTLEKFGGKADWDGATGTNNSPMLQSAIDSLRNGYGGTVGIGVGRFLFSEQVSTKEGGITIYGKGPQATNLIIAQTFAGDSLLSFSNPLGAIGKIGVNNLRIDSSNNLTGVNGINFKFLIYNNEFHNLDFESFTGSWFYTERSGNISEHITWSLIQGNARNVTPTKSPFDLYRINESIVLNAKVFGKQYLNLPYPSVPMFYCDRPQGLTIQSSQFASTTASAVKIECTSGTAQGFFLDDCTFEACYGSDVINISGKVSGQASEYGKIGQNRYIECDNPKIVVDNWIGFEVEDNKPSIELGTGTLQCVATTTMTDGSTIDNTTAIVDNGTNNLSNLIDGSGFVVGVAGASGRYIKTSGKFSLQDYGIAAARKIRQVADYQNADLQRMRFLLDGTTDMGGFTNKGVYGQVKTTAGNPVTANSVEGSMVPNSADNRLYVFVGGSWKYIALT